LLAKNAAALEVMAQDIPRSILRHFARQQRAQAVQAETLIWRSVRNRRCDGAKFRRQVPLANFILPTELVIGSTELAVARIRDAMTK
jgi:very-short-patch-repair endonuclease